MGENAYPLRKIEEMVENHDSRRIPVKASNRKPGPYPYYGAQGIVDYVSDYIFDGEYVLVAEDGENLRSRNEPIGLMAKGKFWVNNHAHILKGNGISITRFVYYAINNSDISGYVSGSTIPKLSQKSLNAILLPCPPIEEQRAIVGVLGALDDKIELNRRTNETLEAMARAIFKDWFVDFGPTRAKKEGRAPYLVPELWALFPDRLDDETGLPEGWQEDMLGSFADIQNGYAFNSKDWREGGIPVVKIGSVKPSFVDLDQVSFIDDYLAVEKSFFRLSTGDMLVGLTGYVGETGRIPPTDVLPMLNQRVGRFLPRSGMEAFIFSCVRQPEFKEFAEAKSHGSAQANVSTRDLLAFPLVNPGEDLIAIFCERTAPLFEKSLTNMGQASTLGKTRDLLLPKLMSGEIRLRDAEKQAGEAS